MTREGHPSVRSFIVDSDADDEWYAQWNDLINKGLSVEEADAQMERRYPEGPYQVLQSVVYRLCRRVRDGDRDAIGELAAVLRKGTKEQLLEYCRHTETMVVSWDFRDLPLSDLNPLGEALEKRAAELKVGLERLAMEMRGLGPPPEAIEKAKKAKVFPWAVE